MRMRMRTCTSMPTRGLSISRVRTLSVLLLLATSSLARAEDSPPPLRDASKIEARFQEACSAVEKVCGAPFEKKPSWKIVSRDEMRKALNAELSAKQLESLGTHVDEILDLESKVVLGKYVPAEHAVLMVPENAEAMAKDFDQAFLLSEDSLRILLAHEVTHALDWLRFPLGKERDSRATADGLKALDAVAEGHAQWVAEKVAAEWGITDAFVRFTRGITELPKLEDEHARPSAEVIAAEMAFAYVQGLAFVKAVHAAKGMAGVEEMLRSPPTGTRAIEHPDEAMAPAGAGTLDPDLILDAWRPMVGDSGWDVNSDRLREAALRTQASQVPEELRKDFLKGYLDGRVILGRMEAEGALLIGTAMIFETAEDAQRMVAVERATAGKAVKSPGLEVLETTTSEGAGPQGRIPGYALVRRLSRFGDEITATSQCGSIGRVMFEIVVMNAPELDRKAQDAAIARLELAVKDPAAARAAAKVDPVRVVRRKRTLTIKVLDPEGKPVPSAGVNVFWEESRDTTRTEMHSARKGSVDVPLPRVPVVVRVYGARDGDRHALPLAPMTKTVDASAETVEIRLEPGVEIAGHVVDEDGKGLGGIEVTALEDIEDLTHHMPFRQSQRGMRESGPAVKTDAEGAFRILGVGRGEHTIEAKTSADGPTIRVAARGGDLEVRIAFPKMTVSTVTVTDYEGKPVPQAPVVLSETHKDPSEPTTTFSNELVRIETDAMGKAEIRVPQAQATYTLGVGAPRSRDDLLDASSRLWEGKPLEVVLEKGFTIRGTVLDTTGAPKAARVVVSTRHLERSTSTGKDGTFVVRGIPFEPARVGAVAADADRRTPPKRWVKVDPERVPTELSVPYPTRTIVARIAGFDKGRGAVILREGTSLEPLHLRAKEAGELELDELSAGDVFTLWIPPSRGGGCLLAKGLKMGDEDLALTLVAGKSVRGWIVAASPMTYPEVAVMGPAGDVYPCSLEEDGSFESAPFPDGTYSLRAKAKTVAGWVYGRMEVTAGSTVEIKLAPK